MEVEQQIELQQGGGDSGLSRRLYGAQNGEGLTVNSPPRVRARLPRAAAANNVRSPPPSARQQQQGVSSSTSPTPVGGASGIVRSRRKDGSLRDSGGSDLSPGKMQLSRSSPLLSSSTTLRTGTASPVHMGGTMIIQDEVSATYVRSTHASPMRKRAPSRDATPERRQKYDALDRRESSEDLNSSMQQELDFSPIEGSFLHSLGLDARALEEFLNTDGQFLYLRQRLDWDSSPYDLEVCQSMHESSSTDGTEALEYCTLSRAGITHFKDSESTFTTLERWEKEYALFHHIRKIPFFAKYRAWKSFHVWRRSVRASHFQQNGDAVTQQLFFFMEPLREAFGRIRGECVDIAAARVLQLPQKNSRTITELSDFFNSHTALHTATQEMLRGCSARIHEYVRTAAEAQIQSFLMSNNIESDHKMTFMEKASLRSETRRLTRFFKLVDFAVADALHDMILDSLKNAARQMDGRDSAGDVPVLFRVTASKGSDDDTVDISPICDEFTGAFRRILDAALSLVQIPQPVAESAALSTYIASEVEETTVAHKEPNIMAVVTDDPQFEFSSNEILESLCKAFDGAAAYLEIFKPYLATFRENEVRIGTVASDLAEAEISVLRGEIQRYRDMSVDFSSVPTSNSVGLLLIDSAELREALLPSPATCLEALQKLLPDIMYQSSTSLLDELGVSFAAVSSGSPAVEDYMAKRKAIASAHDHMESFKATRDRLVALSALVKECDWVLPDSHKAHIIMVEETMTSLESALQIAESMEEEEAKRAIEQIKEEIPRLKKKIVAVREELDAGVIASLDAPPEKVLAFLAARSDDLEGHRSRSSELSEYQMSLGQPPDEYDMLEETQADLSLKVRLWESVRDWRAIKSGIVAVTLSEIDVSALEKKVSGYSRVCAQASRVLPGNPVVASLSAEIHAFSPILPIVSDLRSPALKDRHWQQLDSALGFEISSTESLSLGDLIARGIAQHADAISGYAASAVHEAVLEEMLAKVAVVWETAEVEVKSYKEAKDVFVLGDISEVLASLDDSLVTISTIQGSRYVGGIKDIVEAWKTRLVRMQSTLDEWMACQRNWMYLEPIFSSPDIVRQLPAAAKMFASVDKSWKAIMRATADDPLAIKQGTVADRCEIFAAHNVALDKIQKNLEDYLETKRAAFPRFYFLGNEELLEILSQAREPQAVQPHLQKCFENLVGLQFGPEPGSIDIGAMISSEGERVSLGRNLKARGCVEDWLSQVEARMKVSLHGLMKAGLIDYDSRPRVEWVGAHAGQIVATVAQMMWVRGTEKALRNEEGTADGMRLWAKEYANELNQLVVRIRGDLSKLERKIIVALVTTDVHARDILDELVHGNATSVDDFAWVQQLRYYWDAAEDDCVIRHSDAVLRYGWEYMGAASRLVITPLTDRCWLTLTGSYGLKLGAAPAGPAGTGKTETSKDLAKAIGIFCIVFNCSDQIDYRMMAKLFRGLAQSGCWTCLDEFNRIDIEVLSVIAQQLLELREGRLLGKPDINFMGVQIGLKDHHVIITMNPGYAGRTELPDNLQVCFRPVAMMVPNYALIAEIMLFAEGFSEAKTLSRKMCKLYILCSEQLSQQPHYDYGLRAVKSVLVMAGALKRAMPEGSSEDVTLIRALVDSNVPKFLSDDLPLFAAIVKDLFPGVAIEAAAAGELNVALDAEIQEQGLQRVPRFVEKVIQFFDVLNIRFGATLVGPTGSGKTTCYRLLAAVNDRLREANAADERFQRVHIDVLNPKCITMGELYGEFHPLTLEWHDGLASTIMRRAAGEEGEDRSWVIFDGPIDALWIENMNTVLDDNMTLCLASGERIKLRSQMRMIFEVADLAVASPATVSRIGVVYMTSSDLGWRPFVRSWVPRLDKDTFVCPPMIQERLLQLFEAVTPKMLAFQRKNCEEPVECCDIQLVTSLCTLLQSLIWDGCEVLLDDTTPMPERLSLVDKMFAFSLAWSIGGSTDDRGWDRMDEQAQVACLDAGMQLALPSGKCLFEVYLDVKTNQFLPWTDIISPFDYSASVGDGKGADFFSLVVETEDTTRFRSLLTRLIGQDRPAFVTGATGTGKTAVLNSLLGSLQAPAEEGGMDMLAAPINFSAQTSSRVTQSTLTSKLEKKRRGILGPPGGKKRVGVFVDDVNMPIVEEYGAQPPVELLRQLLDFGGMYDRDKLFWTELEGVLLLTAAAPPGGGRSKVTPRFVRHFNVLCMPRAGEAAMSLIFGSMLKGYWSMGPGFDADVIKRVDSVVAATIEVYTRITAELRPTPSRFHYAFNLRDVSKVFQGMLMVVRAKCRSVRDAVRLWGHEVHRVFRDRLISAGDQSWFDGLMGELLSRHLRVGEDVMLGTDAPVWCDFLKGMGEGAPRLYEESGDTVKLKTILEAALDDYNASHIAQMRLVMFSDAISHVCRAARILRQPRGSAMLVGVGGSGRQSLARLAAFTCGMECMQVEITRGYGIQEFREDLKSAMVKTGVEGKGVAFLMTDTQIVVEAMLEDINNLLNSGEVPDLWNQEELDKVAGDMVPVLRDNDLPGFETRMGCLAAFVKRIRANLHMLLCMSPVGDSLRIRCRNFPALINCTTIDWFFPWPESALVSVAEFLLEGLSLPSDDVRGGIVSMCGAVHTSIADAAIRFHSELRRNVYITPKSYLDLIDSYKRELHNLRGGIDTRLSQMTAGVTKLNETNEMVASLKEELKALEPVLEEKSAAADKLLAQVEIDKAESALVQDRVSKEEQDVGAQAAEVAAVQAEAQAELDVALPALEKALKALDSLTKGDITEVKSFAKPPEAVQIVMEAVCLLFDMKTDWDSAKKLLTDSTFLDKLKSYDKDNIKESTLKKLRVYITNPIMQIDVVSKVSKAATGLCMFVHAMDVYAKVAKVVAPKQARVDELNAVLDSANATLAGKQAELRAVIERVAALQQQCDETVAERTRLAAEADATAKRLIRAEKLTSGLSNEGVRWTAACEVLSANKISIVGDAFIACASLSYLGPFTGSYRAELVSHWIEIGKDAGLPLTDGCGIGSTLGDPVEIREWQNNGLPTDTVSAESAIMVLKGSRWPLVIDPQGQANRWIKNTYSDRMQVTVMSDPNLLRALENCVRNGKVLLLEDVTEHVEPSLEPILQKAVFKQGARTLLRVGDSDVDYDAAFRLFMTSKMPNPHYMPEVCIKVNLTNFTVTMEGLEDQLLGQVVAKERPDVERRKMQLLLRMAEDRKQLADLEARILQLLSASSGNILDDEVLIDTLADSKTTSTIILERVEESERTEKELNIARGGYRPVATRGTLIYFAASDLASVDPMYQYSLQYYRALVDRCVDGSAPSTDLETRLQNILEYMTRTVYENVCRGLFEHHKLLFSVLISIKIQLHDGSVHLPEWTLLLRGAGGENAADALPNPAPGRLADLQWDLLCAAEKRCQVSKPESTEGDEGQAGEVHIHFPLKGLCQDLTGNLAAWMTWADSDSPLQLPLPNNFASSGATAFQKLLLIKALREDRLHFCMAEMVAQHLGRSFAESPGAKMEDIYRDMDNKTPCIFILSKGADPTGMLLRFAAEKGYGSRLSMVSLGQGQGPNAEELVKRGTASGDWVLLQNCMLARSWMPRMEMVVAGLAENTETNHVDFRLFLTSAPAPYFPVFVLQNGVKMTNEPPRGVRANVLRSWGSLIKPEEWDSFDDESAGKPRELKKLLLGLLFFHANVQERRKFGPLGWNISYAFDESDLETSIAVMRRFLKEQEVIPWDALRFVTGQINYGGRVTDDWDRRCITHILKIYLTSEILEEGYRFSDSGVYYSTGASAHGEATSYLSSLPGVDDPEIFGMHQNANITFNTAEGAELLRTLLSLQPRSSAGAAAGAKTDDEVVLELAATIKAEIPSQLDSEEAGPTTFVPGDDGMLGSLAIVLTQEMLKFNRLLHKMSASLDELRDAVHGLAVMNQDLDRMYTSFLSNQVPAIWAGVSFVSLKTLASWVKDLVSRVAFIRSWLKHGQPACFSLPVFFFPQGFMTGVLQTFARRYQVAIDTLSFKHEVLIMKHEEIDQGPEDGVYCSGMWLEGARFDEGQKMLQPSRPGEMYTELPPVHFLPVSGHTPDVRNYLCPVYKTAERKGVLSTTGMSTNFVVAVELPTDADAASWVLSGVAALLNLTD